MCRLFMIVFTLCEALKVHCLRAVLNAGRRSLSPRALRLLLSLCVLSLYAIVSLSDYEGFFFQRAGGNCGVLSELGGLPSLNWLDSNLLGVSQPIERIPGGLLFQRWRSDNFYGYLWRRVLWRTHSSDASTSFRTTSSRVRVLLCSATDLIDHETSGFVLVAAPSLTVCSMTRVRLWMTNGVKLMLLLRPLGLPSGSPSL